MIKRSIIELDLCRGPSSRPRRPPRGRGGAIERVRESRGNGHSCISLSHGHCCNQASQVLHSTTPPSHRSSSRRRSWRCCSAILRTRRAGGPSRCSLHWGRDRTLLIGQISPMSTFEPSVLTLLRLGLPRRFWRRHQDAIGGTLLECGI